jgi:N-formylglutamate amidohydrolase
LHVIVHIPHASRAIPDEFREQFLLSDEALAAELLAMTDLYTDRLFEEAVADSATIVYPVSRLVVDPERFADDALEPMSQRGMGVVYTRTSGGHRCGAPWPIPSVRRLCDGSTSLITRR